MYKGNVDESRNYLFEEHCEKIKQESLIVVGFKNYTRLIVIIYIHF